MAIKRTTTVVVTCDGPCGTVLVDRDSAPDDWIQLKRHDIHQPKNQRQKFEIATLCPKCGLKLEVLLRRNGFGFVKVNFDDQTKEGE